MRFLPVFFVVLLFAGSCAKPTAEELAALAAKGYYDHLMKGEYELFLEGKDGMDSVADDYREQMLTMFKQFVVLQDRAHRGVHEVRIVSAKTDTAQKRTDVFLVLCFGDSTNEEVVVPMVERSDGWKMK